MFMFFVGVVSSEYMPMAVFVEDADKLFHSVKHAAQGKAFRSPYRSLDQGKYGDKELDLP